MAEVPAFLNNVFTTPVWGLPWVEVFPIYDATGGLVSGATGLDSEININGDTWADCTNEAVELGSSGMYYLLLTGVEMRGAIVTVIVKSSGKTTPIVLHTTRRMYIYDGIAQAGAPTTGSIKLSSGASGVNGAYVGCAIESLGELRTCVLYIGATKVAYVEPIWTNSPDDEDYIIWMPPDSRSTMQADVIGADGVGGAGNALADAALKRDWTAITGTVPDRSTLNALRFLRNKWYISGVTLHTTKEDDTTDAWTGVITPAPGTDPISGMDPA